MDHLTPEKRSWNMSRIRGKDTKLEVLVRVRLHGAMEKLASVPY
jgi:DNA mismatch endonuclease (patch repair protein)